MGVREHNIHQGGMGSGYRLVNYEMNWPITGQNSIHTQTGSWGAFVLDHTAFGGSGAQALVCPRTVTITLVTDATVATRRISVACRGTNTLGRSVRSQVDLTATASLTVRAETDEIFAFLEAVEFLSSSGLVAGDNVHIGNFGDASGNLAHFRTIFWGLPVQCKGIRRDLSAGNEGFMCDRGEIIMRMHFMTPSALGGFGPLAAQPISDLRYDEMKGGFRFNAAPVGGAATDPDQLQAAHMLKIPMLIRTIA